MAQIKEIVDVIAIDPPLIQKRLALSDSQW